MAAEIALWFLSLVVGVPVFLAAVMGIAYAAFILWREIP